MGSVKAMRFMHDLLRALLSKNGTDLFITVCASPSIKIDGKMAPLTKQPLSPDHTQVLIRSIMDDLQTRDFEQTQECNLPSACRMCGACGPTPLVSLAAPGWYRA